MRLSMREIRHISRSTKIFIALIALYIGLTFILPANHVTKSMYAINDAQYHSLLFAVRLPILAVWCAAFYSYRRLINYAKQISDTKEGEHFMTLAKGMRWIAWGLIIPAVISTLLNTIANHNSDFLAPALVITNYLYVIVSLIAFTYIGKATHNLTQQSSVHLSVRSIRLLIGSLTALGVVFCVLTASKLNGTSLTDSYNAYYLPNWAIWTTVVVPYLYAWFIGLVAALELVVIARKTSGIIYKQALQLLAAGLVLIIVSMCSLQYFRSVVPRTGHLTIGASLITTYAIYGVNLAGSALLATGVKRLKRIEDI